MTFSHHQLGVVMPSQITPTQASNTHTLAHIPCICALIFSGCPIVYNLHQPLHVTASHSFPGNNPRVRGRAVRKNAGPSKIGGVKLNHLHMYQGSSFLPIFPIVAQPPQSSLCCPWPSSHHPPNLTSDDSVLAVHLHPTSTPV